MKVFTKLSICLFAVSMYFATLAFAQNSPTVDYPQGYRLWTHVKSGIAAPDKAFGGLHQIYANKKAMDGYKTGHFADGSIIVFDLLAIDMKNALPTIGARRSVAVMQRDEKKFAMTGGWGYEEFKGDSRTERNVAENAVAKCFSCHARQKDKQFVFSSFQD